MYNLMNNSTVGGANHGLNAALLNVIFNNLFADYKFP